MTSIHTYIHKNAGQTVRVPFSLIPIRNHFATLRMMRLVGCDFFADCEGVFVILGCDAAFFLLQLHAIVFSLYVNILFLCNYLSIPTI